MSSDSIVVLGDNGDPLVGKIMPFKRDASIMEVVAGAAMEEAIKRLTRVMRFTNILFKILILNVVCLSLLLFL
jgi:hypothetical protein